MSDPNRFHFEGDQHYLKPAQEMRYLFREVPSACDNTLWIAERADVTIEFGKPQLPEFPLPEGFTVDTDYLRHLALEGAERRWGPAAAARGRRAPGLRAADHLGHGVQLLLPHRVGPHQARQGQRHPCGAGTGERCRLRRGVLLDITDLDPIRYDLLFERFLNPSRISMPDIDMDFDSASGTR